MTPKYFANFIFAALVAAMVFLAGCGDKASPPIQGSTPVSIEVIAAGASGFTVGSIMSTRTVYVFFDAQCSHCAELWRSAKPLQSQARFIWVPVGLLNPASTAQGATLLAASNPAAAMDQHEASMTARQGGITASGNTDAQKTLVRKNTELLNKFGINSIPVIISTNAQTGAVISREGALSTTALAAFLDLQVPAGLPASN